MGVETHDEESDERLTVLSGCPPRMSREHAHTHRVVIAGTCPLDRDAGTAWQTRVNSVHGTAGLRVVTDRSS